MTPSPSSQPLDAAVNTARMLYFIHGATFFFSFGLLSIVPLIINYSKRPETVGTFVHSHHSWMIKSFWWYAIWCLVSIVVALTIIGIPIAIAIFGAAWLWKAYRLIRGFVDLNASTAMPA